MKKHYFKDKAGERAINAEQYVARRLQGTFEKLERHKTRRANNIDRQKAVLERELISLGCGLTNMKLYFSSDVRAGAIQFPFGFTSDKSLPRPCCIGKSAINEKCCRYFPCRKISRVNCKCTLSLDNSSNNLHANQYDSLQNTTIREKPTTPLQSAQGNYKKNNSATFVEYYKYYNISVKEIKLKQIVQKLRIANERENKPQDRNLNYGQSTPFRRLQRPVRPVISVISNVSRSNDN